jgi:hypothetical protein
MNLARVSVATSLCPPERFLVAACDSAAARLHSAPKTSSAAPRASHGMAVRGAHKGLRSPLGALAAVRIRHARQALQEALPVRPELLCVTPVGSSLSTLTRLSTCDLIPPSVDPLPGWRFFRRHRLSAFFFGSLAAAAYRQQPVPAAEHRAINSVVECHLHTVEVSGSNPLSPTIISAASNSRLAWPELSASRPWPRH